MRGPDCARQTPRHPVRRAEATTTRIEVRRASSVERRASSVERRASSVERRASSVERRASSVERRASSVERRASSVERRASSVERRASSVERRASSVERRAHDSCRRRDRRPAPAAQFPPPHARSVGRSFAGRGQEQSSSQWKIDWVPAVGLGASASSPSFLQCHPRDETGTIAGMSPSYSRQG